MLLTSDVYSSIIFFKNNKEKAKLLGNLNKDFIAGLIICFKTIFLSVSSRENIKNFRIQLKTLDNHELNINISHNTLIDNYSLYTNIDKQLLIGNIIPYNYINYYGFWIIDDFYTNSYTLYVFKNIEFLKGFIMGFELFDLDFRNYSLGKPFISKSRENYYFNIKGYDIDNLENYNNNIIYEPIIPYYNY